MAHRRGWRADNSVTVHRTGEGEIEKIEIQVKRVESNRSIGGDGINLRYELDEDDRACLDAMGGTGTYDLARIVEVGQDAVEKVPDVNGVQPFDETLSEHPDRT